MINNSFFLIMIFFAQIAAEAKPKTIQCSDTKSQTVAIPYNRVVALNFPSQPKEVIPGDAGFDFKTIRSDLIIKSLRASSRTNLLVYLEGRRCSFQLVSQSYGDEIIFVRDPKEKTFEVKFNGK